MVCANGMLHIPLAAKCCCDTLKALAANVHGESGRIV